jgi:7,8-dihydroneopterin aldolase/epimerase/oxygenase
LSAQFTIELNGLRFFAEHGMYKEEMSVGNEFEVDVSIVCKAPKKEITSIEQTVNYAEVYRILQEEFAVRRQLLESSAMHIGEKLQEQFPEIRKLVIRIKKLNPPITNFSGTVGITYEKEFKG